MNFKTTWSEFQVPSQTAPAEAKPRSVYSIKTTWSEFQMPSQADCSHRGEAKVRVFDFKTTFSEFQIPSQNTLAKAKPRYVFRVSSPPQSRSKAVVCVSTPRMYPRSGYFLVIAILVFSAFRAIHPKPHKI